MPIERVVAATPAEVGVDPDALERLFAAAAEEVSSGRVDGCQVRPQMWLVFAVVWPVHLIARSGRVAVVAYCLRPWYNGSSGIVDILSGGDC